MVERALTDPDPNGESRARALGPMRAESSVPKLKGLLSDSEPLVVLAASRPVRTRSQFNRE